MILKWNLDDGLAVPITGQGHTNSVTQAFVQVNHLVTIAMDDTIRFTPLDSLHYSQQGLKLDAQPQGAAGSIKSNLVVVVTLNSVLLIRDEKIVHTVPTKYQPTSVALSVDDAEVAVGAKDNSIHIYSLAGDSLKEEKVLSKHRGFLTALTYSPDGQWLASADQNREIVVWDKASHTVKIEGWVYHDSRVTTLAWNPNSKFLVSGALDSHVIVWSLIDTSKQITMKTAHRGGVNSVLWMNETTVASTGLDCSIKTWTIKI